MRKRRKNYWKISVREKYWYLCLGVLLLSTHRKYLQFYKQKHTHRHFFGHCLYLSTFLLYNDSLFLILSHSLPGVSPPHAATDNVHSLPVFWSSSILNKWSKLVGKQEQERKQQKRERRERKRESETEANCMSDVQIFVARQRKIVSSLLEICGKKGWVRLKEGHAATEKKWLINYE